LRVRNPHSPIADFKHHFEIRNVTVSDQPPAIVDLKIGDR
jgi:hypothetical protein